jgi:hypothetical protein
MRCSKPDHGSCRVIMKASSILIATAQSEHVGEAMEAK